MGGTQLNAFLKADKTRQPLYSSFITIKNAKTPEKKTPDSKIMSRWEMTSRLKSKHGPLRQPKRECLRTFYVYAFTPPSRATSSLSPAAPAVLFHNKIPFLFIIRKWSPTHIFPIKPLIYLLLAFNHYILCLETHRRRLLNYSRKSAKRLWQIRKFSLSGIEQSSRVSSGAPRSFISSDFLLSLYIWEI